jgi:hypothetical protein
MDITLCDGRHGWTGCPLLLQIYQHNTMGLFHVLYHQNAAGIGTVDQSPRNLNLVKSEERNSVQFGLFRCKHIK